jgi:hypothetical protein
MIAEAHIEELRALCPEAHAFTEGSLDYVLLPGLRLPAGCNPAAVDCLLCLGQRDGYDNRLLFATIVDSPTGRNWNTQNARIAERNWFAYSWRVPTNLRPLEILIGHLRGLRP